MVLFHICHGKLFLFQTMSTLVIVSSKIYIVHWDFESYGL